MSIEPTQQVDTTGIPSAVRDFFTGLAYAVGVFGAFWAYDTYFAKHDPATTIPIDGANLSKILGFLGVVALLFAVSYAFGQKGADAAEKKQLPRTLGFLLGFYFNGFGLLFLRSQPGGMSAVPITEETAPQSENISQSSLASVGPQRLALPVYGARRPSFLAAFVVLGIGAVLTWVLQARGEDLGGRAVSVATIPYEVGEWRCMGEQTSDASSAVLFRRFGMKDGKWSIVEEQQSSRSADTELMQQLKADSYLLRNYLNSRSGELVQLYVVYRRYGRREFNHNPDMCFPAGGYILKNREIASLPYGGQDVPAVHMTFDGSKVQREDGQVGMPETTVSYLFASGKKTEHDFLKQQFWMALERLIPNKNGWALIRLTTAHSRYLPNWAEQPIMAAEAFAAQQTFMRAFGAEIEKAITTDTTENERSVRDSSGQARGMVARRTP